MNPRSQALANSAFRPAKTSKLNPYRMTKTGWGETKVAPKISALRAMGDKIQYPGHASIKPSRAAVGGVSESKAYYAAGRVDARNTAADMVRRYRKTGKLSAIERLTELSARLEQ